MPRSAKIGAAVVLWVVASYLLWNANWREGVAPPAEWQEKIPAPKDLRRLSILTYNVLSSDDEYEVARRLPSVIGLLRDSDADVIVLQEAVPSFLQRLLQEEWVRKKYHGALVDGRVIAPAGQYILSRLPISLTYFEFLPGRQRRAVLLSVVEVGGKPYPQLPLVNVHLESFRQDGLIRAHQLQFVFNQLVPERGEAAVVGDFNFGDGSEPETSQLDPTYRDVWKALRPGLPGLTWDMDRNGLAKRNALPEDKNGRIDRVLLRSVVWKPVEVKIIGDQPLEAGKNDLFPSDHFGLLATFARRTPEEIEQAVKERERAEKEREKARPKGMEPPGFPENPKPPAAPPAIPPAPPSAPPVAPPK